MLVKKPHEKTGGFFLKSYALVMGLCLSASSFAEEWYIQPSFSLRTEYDDNKRLLTDTFVRDSRERGDEVDTSAYGIITTADAKAGVRSEIYDVFFKGKVAVKKYFSDLDLDSEDFFLDLNTSYNLNERNRFGFSAGYNQESTLTAELDVTGLSQENIPRRTWSISPDWIHYLSETKYIQASYSHTDVSYEQSTRRRFSDYIYDSVSLTFFHQWNEKLQNFATVGWSKFEVPESKRETDEYMINAGLNYSFSETWTASLMGGVRFTQTEGFEGSLDSIGRITGISLDGGSRLQLEGGRIVFSDDVLIRNGEAFVVEQIPFSDNQTGLVFSLSTDKQFETGNVGASYSRSTSPTGDGSLRTVDRFSVDYLHKITKHLHFVLNGAVHITKATSNENLNRDRTYYSVTPTLRWQFNRQLSLSGGYRYRRQEFESTNATANVNNTKSVGESNAVFLTLKYQWDKFTTQEF